MVFEEARTAEDSGHVSRRIVSQQFREPDELQSPLGVVVIATTNRFDLMEQALALQEVEISRGETGTDV